MRLPRELDPSRNEALDANRLQRTFSRSWGWFRMNVPVFLCSWIGRTSSKVKDALETARRAWWDGRFVDPPRRQNERASGNS